MGTADELWERLYSGMSDSELEPMLAEALERREMTASAVAAARGINRRLSQRQAREDLLRVLHDTATDLTGIRDVEAILQAIVQRTRSLTGSDMSYISLNDYERQETFIRKSDGVITEGFQTIRMPIGTGVLGKAANGLSSYHSADYLDDPDIVHLPTIDATVRAEGVRAILGVPMNLHGSVVGALLIAHRSTRHFSVETIDLVNTIAKHAAVALDNAQRFAEITEALEHLGKERKSRLVEMTDLQTVISLDERLIETVVGGRGLDGYVDLVHQVLATGAAVLDPAGGLLAAHGARQDTAVDGWPERVVRVAGNELGECIARATATGEPQSVVLASKKHDSGKYTVVPAKSGGAHLATLVLHDDIPGENYGLLKRLSIFLTVLRLFDNAAHDAAQRLQFEVLDDILTERHGTSDEIRRRAARFGLRPTQRLTFAVVDAKGADYRRAESCIRTALGNTPALIANHRAHICVLLVDGHTGIRQIKAALDAAGISTTVGFAGPYEGFEGLATLHRQAERALSTLRILDRGGEILDGTRLGAVGLLLDAAASQLPGYDLFAEVGPLLDYDREHGTALTETAWVYLETLSSLARTAAKLFVHRNTVRQRLDRIGTLLGDDWNTDTRHLDVHLALRIWRLQTSSEHSDWSNED